MKRFLSIFIVLALLISALPVFAEEDAVKTPVTVTVPGSAVSGTPESCGCEIVLNGTTGTVTGEGAAVENGVLTITGSGSYLISGTFTGTIVVNVTKEKKVELDLNGLYLTGSVNVTSAPKNVTIKACEGSVNVINDQSAAATEDATAAIDSSDDLKFAGKGALYVVSANNRGIHSSDDIEIDNIELYVISAGNGIQGKDSVTIAGGTVYVNSGKDGIKSTNSEDEGKGFVLISGGTVTVVSAGDGIQAAGSVSITGGEIEITAGDGYTASTKTHSDSMWGGGHGGKSGWGGSTTATTTGTSAKGIKSAGDLTIDAGSVYINSSDDAVHSDKNTTVNGGTLTVWAGDDGLHAYSILTINGGNIDIKSSYEGLEGTVININGGEVRLVTSDDGINAGGDDSTVTSTTSSSSSWGGRGGMDGNGLGELNITGGYIVVNAAGDGIDSNNTGSMSGGTLIVYGPTDNSNAALDYQNSFTWTGGTIIALGSSGMAQTVSASGSGAVLAFTLSMQANTLLTITDSNGSDVLAVAGPKSYSCVVFASTTLVSGETYSVYSGGSNSGIMTDYIYSLGTTTGATLLGSLQAS